jgi:hypothetical protein
VNLFYRHVTYTENKWQEWPEFRRADELAERVGELLYEADLDQSPNRFCQVVEIKRGENGSVERYTVTAEAQVVFTAELEDEEDTP